MSSDPKAGREILKNGKFASAATDIATRTAVGVGVGIGTGFNTTSCFADPFNSNPCAPVWNWWCSPGWSWWWSTWCSPWWGYGWGFGYCSDWFGFWYSGWPSYRYYPSYYAPYPVYYSTVIYDSYDPPPAVEVSLAEPSYEPSYVDPGLPVAQGEGSIQVAGYEAGGENRPRLGSSSQFLNLGDQAFWEGRYSEAVHYYAKAVELEPEQGVLHLILSDALFATGDYHYAAYSLRRALELDPTVIDSIVDKHKFYADPGEFDRQVQILESYLGDHFLDDDARLLLSANYLFGGHPAQAADLLQSPFSVAIRESGAGKVLLDRARILRRGEDSGSSPR
ncbi:MAG: tetratricopeptide repeat protein [Planctomycetota bacterium]